MPSLRCLVSALTQAGGGGLLLRFAGSVQSCCGEGGALQTDIAVCGELSPCSGHTGFAPHRGVCAFPSALLGLPAALYGAGPAFSAVPVFGSSTTARIRMRLPVVSSPASAVQAARGLRAFSRARRAFSHCGTAFTVSYRFWVVVFSFSFISMHILISFLISSMMFVIQKCVV